MIQLWILQQLVAIVHKQAPSRGDAADARKNDAAHKKNKQSMHYVRLSEIRWKNNIQIVTWASFRHYSQHLLRVYHLVETWRGIGLALKEWGCMTSYGRLAPFPMPKRLAPAELLEIIRCSCETKCSLTALVPLMELSVW